MDDFFFMAENKNIKAESLWSFFVLINDVLICMSGIPQGSVLGPVCLKYFVFSLVTNVTLVMILSLV